VRDLVLNSEQVSYICARERKMGYLKGWRLCRGMTKDCCLCSHLAGCLFSALTREELSQLASYRRPLCLQKNTIVYSQGGSAEGVYFLCQGTMKLVWVAEGGEQRIVGFIRAGEMFGLDSLIPGSARVFTTITRGKCEVIYFDRRNFSRILRSKSGFLLRFAAILNHSLHQSQLSHVLLSGNRVRKRVQNALLQCALGISDLKQVELAQLLGVSAETINRKLRNASEADTKEDPASVPDPRAKTGITGLAGSPLTKIKKIA
jgi:CRP/FNR family cyclic AMP-dependent transcriptional regulator